MNATAVDVTRSHLPVFRTTLPNKRSVTGYPASGGVLTDTVGASQNLLSRSEIFVTVDTVVIDSDGVDGDSAGDTVAYNIKLTNTGTTTLVDATISDTLLDEQEAR